MIQFQNNTPGRSSLWPHCRKGKSCCTPVLFVFYRYNSECTEAFQESPSETAVLLLYQEMQGGAEESPGAADGLRHYKT